jgi:hypothetical protein
MITYVGKARPARNDPCHCGSDRKYKKCCEEADEKAASAERQRASAIQSFTYEEASSEVLALKAQVDRRRQSIREYLSRDYGVLIGIVPPVDHGGGRVWAIGNRVFTDCPANQTFHEFITGLLRQALGREWFERQEALSADEEQHLYRCVREYIAWTERISDERDRDVDGLYSAPPSGSVQYLLSLAWDVALLWQATGGPPPEALMERLRDRHEYQGARYELAIAALFARVDCAIEFLDDEKLRDRKHGEFIATHRPSGERVVVEAKSRRRAGVINEVGEFNPDDPLRGDRRALRNLIANAMAKDPGGLPFLIFVDINAPVEEYVPGVEPPWQREVRKLFGRIPEMTGEKPASFQALYATNFSPHYQGEDLARGGEWFCQPPAQSSATDASHLVQPINYALDRIELVPDIAVDGEVR